MRIGVPAEVRAGETRVAATPDTVKRLAAKNEVRIQAGAGAGSSIRDSDFAAAGAKVVGSAAEAYDAEMVVKVRAPTNDELDLLKSNSILIGLLDPFNAAGIEALARRGVTAFAMEWLPRISRAQSMDVLSSQANIAGYKAIVLAAAEIGRFFPMLMTAAGTVKASRVLIPGRPAPRLIKEETVKAMKPGAVIVDLAVEQGGNVEGIERGRTVVKHGVKLIGQENLPATVASDASALYARNLYNFLVLMLDPKSGAFKLDRGDEIIAGTLVCMQGEVLKKG